jgi:hypothetical protein
VRNIGHFSSGCEVKGTSGRTADIFERGVREDESIGRGVAI